MKKGIQIKQFCISSRQKLWRKLLVMSRSSLSFQLAVLLPLFILTVIVFFFVFFGLDTSQNCSIYPPSWNEILIYVTCFLKGVRRVILRLALQSLHNIAVYNTLVCHSYTNYQDEQTWEFQLKSRNRIQYSSSKVDKELKSGFL